MDKVTTDDLFDYWQVSVSVRHARIQYLFELEDTVGEKILYGDRGVAAYTKENLDFVMNGFKLPLSMRSMVALYRIGWLEQFGIRFS